jgi:hypothetical protein
MTDEFVFSLPGNPDETYPLISLKDYDRIIGEEIQNWETNVRRGFVLLFQVSQNGKDNNPRPVSLGLISVEDARRKFG